MFPWAHPSDMKLREHLCEQCGASFKRHSAVAEHVASRHSTDKPFACPVPGCAYRAKLAKQIGAHLRTSVHASDKASTLPPWLLSQALQVDHLLPTAAAFISHEPDRPRLNALVHASDCQPQPSSSSEASTPSSCSEVATPSSDLSLGLASMDEDIIQFLSDYPISLLLTHCLCLQA